VKLFELALFKLAESGKISLEQAKILKTVREKRACSAETLSKESGVEEPNFTIEIVDLLERKIVSQKAGIYFCENFAEKLSQLIGWENALYETARAGNPVKRGLGKKLEETIAFGGK